MAKGNPLNRLIKKAMAVLVVASGLSGADMCYDPPQRTGLCLGLLGLNCTETTPIRNLSGLPLSNVTVVKAYQGLELDVLAAIGIDGAAKTVNADGDEAEFDNTLNDLLWLNGLLDLNLFNKGVVYRTGNYAPSNPSSADDQHTIYTRTLLSVDLSSIRYLATYSKGGMLHHARLYPCGTKLVSILPQSKSVVERDRGTNTPVYFTVSLSESPTRGSVSVNYTITPGTATQGSDYNATSYSGTLTFDKNTNTLTQSIVASVIGDDINESNETFSAGLTTLTQVFNENFTIDESFKNSAVTIVDDDNVSGGITPIVYLPGVVDTVDTYQTALSPPFYQRVLKTKIAGKPGMTLDAVYLGADMLADFVYNAADMPVLMYLYNPSTDTITRLYEQANPTEPLAAVITEGTIKGTTPLFTMPAAAKKEDYILMKYLDYEALYLGGGPNCLLHSSTGANAVPGMPSCVASDIQYLDAFHQEAYDRCKESHGEPCNPAHHGRSGGGDPNYPGYDPAYDHKYGCYECTIGATGLIRSVDNFAIRPEKFDITSTHYDWANILRAGEDYNTTIKAYTYGTTTPTPDYNQTRSNLTLNQTLYYQDGTTAGAVPMLGTLSWRGSDFNMTNGISLNPATGTNEAAGVTFDEVGKVGVNLVDMDWAAVDLNNPNDTTPADCSAAGAYICGDRNVTFVPHHFDFHDLNITNNNGNPGTFTYIADEVEQMGGRIQTRMRALNKDGNETRNFAAYPLWENSVTVTPAVFKSAYVHPDANETIINDLAIGFADGNKTITWDETNTSQMLRFNFQRDLNTPAVAFDVNGTELNITIHSVYMDADTWPGVVHTATITGDRNATADGNATFVYGRLIPRDIRVFGDTIHAVASAWYEVFNKPSLGAVALPPSRNETGWFVNILHDDLSDGDGMVTQLQTAGAPSVTHSPPVSAGSVQGVESYDFGPLAIGGYKAHIDTDQWLWYGTNALVYTDPATGNTAADCLHHPCFNITVVPAIGATGSAKEGSEGTKGSKKSDGDGAWKSRKDYAPAVR